MAAFFRGWLSAATPVKAVYPAESTTPVDTKFDIKIASINREVRDAELQIISLHDEVEFLLLAHEKDHHFKLVLSTPRVRQVLHDVVGYLTVLDDLDDRTPDPELLPGLTTASIAKVNVIIVEITDLYSRATKLVHKIQWRGSPESALIEHLLYDDADAYYELTDEVAALRAQVEAATKREKERQTRWAISNPVRTAAVMAAVAFGIDAVVTGY